MQGRWTICANKRPGLEGAPMVLDGPRVDLYAQVPVVPCDGAAIERAARAVCDGEGEIWEDLSAFDQTLCRQTALTVLRAAGETP